MATRLPKYRMKDGITRLGASYFNSIWADLDSRLDSLERLRASWTDAVRQLEQFGLERIDNSLVPVLEQAQNLMAQVDAETETLAQDLVDSHLQPLVDNFDSLFSTAQQEAEQLSQLLQDANWQVQLDSLVESLAAVATSGEYSDLSGTPALGTAAAKNVASDAELRAGSQGRVVVSDKVYSANAPVISTGSGGFSLDLQAGRVFQRELTGTSTLSNPTNATPGQTGLIYIIQDASGGRTLDFGTYWKHIAEVPTIDDTPSVVNVFSYYVRTPQSISLSYLGVEQ